MPRTSPRRSVWFRIALARPCSAEKDAHIASAMRQRVEQSGPDLEVSRMVPREIDLGLIPDIADDTFDLLDRYPLLRAVLLVALALLGLLAIREGFFR